MTSNREQIDAIMKSGKIRTQIEEMHNIYKIEMSNGTRLQVEAWKCKNEAEAASAAYVEMRTELRARKGADGYGNATNDYSYSQYSEAQKAGKDNGWYMTQASMYANLAAMHFAKASAVSAEMLRLQQQLQVM